MKATKTFYLAVRPLFIRMGLYGEINKLDSHFELVILYSKKGEEIKILNK